MSWKEFFHGLEPLSGSDCSGKKSAITTPTLDKLHRDIRKEREEQARLNPAQFSDWDEAKKLIQDLTS